MFEPKSRFLTCDGKRIHFLDWEGPGDSPDKRCVIIWHGVTGRCSDHYNLATRLAGLNYRVIAPDAPGCGLSDWAKTPERDHSLASYAEIARALMTELNFESVDWIGSSKGGALGIVLAGTHSPARINRLILNDVGIGLPERFRASLRKMLGTPPLFDSFEGFEGFVRGFLEKGGLTLTEAEWRNLAQSWSRRTDDGRFTFHHDPALAEQIVHSPEDFDLWPQYDKVTAKTLLMRAAHSVVPDEEARAMATRGPRARVINRPGGHITLVNETDQQDLILDFLNDKLDMDHDAFRETMNEAG